MSYIYIYIYIYIYMEHPFLMFLDHTQRRSTVGRIPLDEWSPRRRDLYLTTHDTHNRQISMPPVGFEPPISAGERPQAAHLLRSSHLQWPSGHIINITTLGLPILRLSCRRFWQSITSPRSVSPLQPRFGSLRLTVFPKSKNKVEREEICECNGHTVHKLSQRCLTAD